MACHSVYVLCLHQLAIDSHDVFYTATTKAPVAAQREIEIVTERGMTRDEGFIHERDINVQFLDHLNRIEWLIMFLPSPIVLKVRLRCNSHPIWHQKAQLRPCMAI